MDTDDILNDLKYQMLPFGLKRVSIITPLLWVLGFTDVACLTVVPFVKDSCLIELCIFAILISSYIFFGYVYWHLLHNKIDYLQTEDFNVAMNLIESSKERKKIRSLEKETRTSPSAVNGVDEDEDEDEGVTASTAQSSGNQESK